MSLSTLLHLMDFPPSKKSKKIQTTLFGGVALTSAVHSGWNLYMKFVDSFVVGHSDQRASCVAVYIVVDPEPSGGDSAHDS